MAITATTLAGAVGVNDTVVNLTSATAATAPTSTTGVGFTYIKIDAEYMFVNGAPVGNIVPVNRGVVGSVVTSHATSTPVLLGGPSDFPSVKPNVIRFQALGEHSIGPPLTGASITPTGGAIHHYTGTTQLAHIVPPDVYKATQVTLSFDGSASGLTWSAAGDANSISVAGSVTALQTVTFTYDPSTTFWYPSTIT